MGLAVLNKPFSVQEIIATDARLSLLPGQHRSSMDYLPRSPNPVLSQRIQGYASPLANRYGFLDQDGFFHSPYSASSARALSAKASGADSTIQRRIPSLGPPGQASIAAHARSEKAGACSTIRHRLSSRSRPARARSA